MHLTLIMAFSPTFIVATPVRSLSREGMKEKRTRLRLVNPSADQVSTSHAASIDNTRPTLVPSLDDFAQSDLEGEGLLARVFRRPKGQEQVAVLAVACRVVVVEEEVSVFLIVRDLSMRTSKPSMGGRRTHQYSGR